MSFEIKSTNLLLLRNILEGKYDEILEGTKENVVITNEAIGFLSNFSRSTNDSKNTTSNKQFRQDKKCKKKRHNQEFYFIGNNPITRIWLKEKKILSEKRKLDLKRQRKMEQSRISEETKLKMEKESLAREAYDRWLTETRNTAKSKCHRDTESNDSNRRKNSTEALEAFNLWLIKKKKEKESTVKTDVKDNAVFKVKTTESPGTNSAQRPKESISTPSISNRKGVTKAIEPLPKTLEIDEDINRLVTNLRKEKMKEKERSKVRVDSGIFFKRESQKSARVNRARESLSWRYPEEDETMKVERVTRSSGGNSRSRHVDRISHEHANPFVVDCDLITMK